MRDEMDRRTFTRGALAAALLASNAGGAAEGAFLDATTLRGILDRRIDVQKRSVGMVAGLLSGKHEQFVCAGRERMGDSRRVTPDTVFEIGSITKCFTALLLANLARRGELAFEDPVVRHLPADFRLPEVRGRPITLADLATHFAGLQRMPSFRGALFSDEWLAHLASYTLAEFKAWLAAEHPPPPPEAGGWWYSNAGYALLGMALAHRGGRPFETLLKERILDPAGLRDTAFRPTARMRQRLAGGHGKDLEPLAPFDGGIFLAAGALRSTARDLARFVRALQPGGVLAVEQRLALTIRRPAPLIGGDQALGWEVRNAPGGPFVTKDGVTWGQTAALVLDPAAPRAVAVLSNTFPDLSSSTLSGGGVGAADLAQHLLRPGIPLEGAGGTHY